MPKGSNIIIPDDLADIIAQHKKLETELTGRKVGIKTGPELIIIMARYGFSQFKEEIYKMEAEVDRKQSEISEDPELLKKLDSLRKEYELKREEIVNQFVQP